MRKSKFGGEQKLKILNSEKLPKYLIKNINKYKEWLEQTKISILIEAK